MEMATDGTRLEAHRTRYPKGTGLLRPPKETNKVTNWQDRLSKVFEGVAKMNRDEQHDSEELPPWVRYTQDEIKQHMKDMSGYRCRVCSGVIDHHSEDALRDHLKILSRWTNPKRNIIGGLIFGTSIAVSICLLAWYWWS